MEVLYHQTNRSLQEVHDGILKGERSIGSENAGSYLRELQLKLEQIISNCDRLDVLVQKEPVTRRQNAKLRVDQLKHDVRHLQASLRNLEAKQAMREQQEKSREQLLHMRFTTNAAASASGGDSETSILIDRALEHNSALERSHRGIDDLLSQGANMLDSLRDQRFTIKGIQKKVLDVASTLGMSSTVMRLIERRQQGDTYILIGGMVVTVIIMIVVVRIFLY